MNHSTNINDHTDIGLNAEWAVSTYQLDADHFIFDDEIGCEDWQFTLAYVPSSYYDGDYDAMVNLFTGTFGECVEHYNSTRRSN